MGFKIFDSHARDLYGRGQPQGKCVLLEILSLDSLVHYFQSIHNNGVFEVRGVQIENIQNRMVSQNSLNETINFNLSCAVALYSLCYSIMKSCNYWNYNSSLPTIVDKGKKMCCKSSLEHNQQSPVNLPRTVDVCETEVNLDNLFKSEGLLTDSLQSKSVLENEVIHNSECTGFSISFSSYCISCTFKPTKRSIVRMSFFTQHDPCKFFSGIQLLKKNCAVILNKDNF